MLEKLRNEPARVVAVVIALIGLAAAFGLGVTDDQAAAIVSVVGSLLALLGGETIRAQVMPMGKVRQRIARAHLCGREEAIAARQVTDPATTEVPPPGAHRMD